MEIKSILIKAFGAIVVVFIVALVIFNINDNKSTEDTEAVVTSQSPMHKQYPGLPEQNRFVIEAGNEIIERFENGTGVIFLGFKECPWCQKTAPLINQAAESEDTSIHYLDIREERDNVTPVYQQIVSLLSPHLPKDENGSVRISTPDISFVKDGEIVWRHEMDAITDEENTPETYWTEERQQRAIENFREQMKKLKEA